MHAHAQPASPATTDQDIDLMDLLIALARQKKWILGCSAIGTALALSFNLLATPIFSASTRIMPPQQQSSGMNALLGQLGGLAGAAGGVAGLKNPNELYVGMLQSRSVADPLIARFQLKARYQAETMDATRSELLAATTVSSGKDGLITISVNDEDPKFAATLANAYVEQLVKLNQTLAVTDAAKRRLFFETQLKQTKAQLTQAETALRQTQESTGILQPEGQMQAIVGSVTQLKASIAAKEVQLEAMKSFATAQNPQYLRAQQELIGLQAQLAKLETGKGSAGDIQVPTGKLPQSGLEYLRKLREVKYYETIFELLAKQYEMARIDEAKDSSLIQVLDPAVVPELKSKPKRSLIVALGLIAGLLIGIALALLREHLASAPNAATSRRRELILAWKGN